MSNHKNRIEAEIFSVGTWNGHTVTQADLEQMVTNFVRLKDQLRPPLKFGHDARQTLLGQADGDPALGWVDKLRVVGDKLVATFRDVAPVVRQAILAGRYRRVSAEIYTNVRQGGKDLGSALKAVALLGADLPAVTNLKDLAVYMTAGAVDGLELGPGVVFTLAFERGRVAPLAQETQPMQETADNKSQELELAELRAFKARVEAQNLSAPLELGFAQGRGDVVRQAGLAVREGRMTPAEQSRLLAEVEGQAQHFSQQDGLKISWAWVRDFVAQAPARLPMGERAHAGGAQDGLEENPSQKLARLSSNKMVELNLTYGQAADYVLKNDPVLASQYRDFTLNAHLGG